MITIAPEPEPEFDCIQVIQLDITSYILMFFGAGVGWFFLGYLSLMVAHRRRASALAPILASSVVVSSVET